METINIRINSAESTEALAEKLGELLQPGDCLAFYGDLGAGKTTFTKGLARGAGYTGAVSSPTFVLMHIYEGRVPIYHFDAYRLQSSADLYNIGADEYFEGDGAVCLEWSERAEDILPPERLELHLTYAEGEQRETARHIECIGRGARGEEMARILAQAAEEVAGAECNAV
ncbi:MAG: tRNA (adenosine(37)-N6)-threonylcarbamoyltransferase complex ATPase subunit type 1 TsaE [bacterium]|nr:tRNA (adenosine(37)-N6)-threonylcarbamoyltransferase complex ATPase subunit type 1 TsaE [bacterium]